MYAQNEQWIAFISWSRTRYHEHTNIYIGTKFTSARQGQGCLSKLKYQATRMHLPSFRWTALQSLRSSSPLVSFSHPRDGILRCTRRNKIREQIERTDWGTWMMGQSICLHHKQHDSHAICSALLIQIQLAERFTASMRVTSSTMLL